MKEGNKFRLIDTSFYKYFRVYHIVIEFYIQKIDCITAQGVDGTGPIIHFLKILFKTPAAVKNPIKIIVDVINISQVK